MMPSVAELSYFLEVTNTLNFSLAAKNLKISQPSLSRSMKNLEHTVGTNLFIRHKKGVVLTPAGEQILIQVKPLLKSWQNTKLHALASHEQIEGDVKIGCHPAIGMFIHGMLTELLETYPKLNIEIIHDASDKITQQVIDLNIDIGLVSNPLRYPDLIIRELKQVETTLWINDTKRKLQDLHSGETVLICNGNSRDYHNMLKQCKAAGIEIKRLLKVNSIETIASLTANGCGIGLLPACYVQGLYDGKLFPVHQAPVLRDDLCLIYHSEYTKVKAIQTVLDTIKIWVQASTCLSTLS